PPAPRAVAARRDRVRDLDPGRARGPRRSRRDRAGPVRRPRPRAGRRRPAARRRRVARRASRGLARGGVPRSAAEAPDTRGRAARRAAAAAELARLAGKIALDYFERTEITWKADDSMVTEADVAIESWLEDEIAGAFPADGILGEEGTSKSRLRPGARFVWVIDPVDGTNNFGRGIPGFAISVGVLRDGMPYAGAAYDPAPSP